MNAETLFISEFGGYLLHIIHPLLIFKFDPINPNDCNAVGLFN